MKNKNNLKNIVVIGLFLMTPFIMTSCGKPNTIIETKADYNIQVPLNNNEKKSMNFNTYIPTFKIINNRLKFDELDKGVIVKGKDLKIEGSNTDEIANTSFYIKQEKLSDAIKNDDDYYKNVTNLYNNRSDAEEISEDKIKRKAKPYLNDYILTGILYYSGTISSDVTIDKITIPKYDFSYDFYNCNIELVKNDINAIEDDEKIIKVNMNSPEYTYTIPAVNWCTLSGKFINNANDMNILSLNSNVKMVKDKLVKKDYKKDIQFYDNFSYLSENITIDPAISGTCASLICQTKSTGNTYWKPVIQTTCIDGKYLLASVL